MVEKKNTIYFPLVVLLQSLFNVLVSIILKLIFEKEKITTTTTTRTTLIRLLNTPHIHIPTP